MHIRKWNVHLFTPGLDNEVTVHMELNAEAAGYIAMLATALRYSDHPDTPRIRMVCEDDEPEDEPGVPEDSDAEVAFRAGYVAGESGMLSDGRQATDDEIGHAFHRWSEFPGIQAAAGAGRGGNIYYPPGTSPADAAQPHNADDHYWSKAVYATNAASTGYRKCRRARCTARLTVDESPTRFE